MTTLPPWTLARVSPEAMRELAVLLDDPNPIHLDAGAARRAGLGDRVVNQGPVSCGYIVSMLERAFPEGIIRAMRFRFLANVCGGDRVTAGGAIVRSDAEEDHRRVHCRVWLDVAGGPRAVEGEVEIVVPG